MEAHYKRVSAALVEDEISVQTALPRERCTVTRVGEMGNVPALTAGEPAKQIVQVVADADIPSKPVINVMEVK